MGPRILIVEDDKSFARIAQMALESAGYSVDVTHNAADGKSKLASGEYDAVITDLKLPDEDGVAVLGWVNRNISTPPPVLVMTAFATVQTAINAMKEGAADYLTKPFSNDELVLAVGKMLRISNLERENRVLREALISSSKFENIIGSSAPMQAMFDLMRKAAPREVNVLIRGESGTGKELVARAIHFASPRSKGPFVPVDSASIPENLLESELFGHTKGAFTGAIRDTKGKIRSAHGGSIFFDEIGDMPLGLQSKLLRVLQEREVTPVGSEKSILVDIRVIAATNVALEEAISAGRFREDLYFRLNVVTITVPPLRDRKDDIPQLVKHFISGDTSGVMGISHDALKALANYNWPGNVRELQNAMEHAMVLAGDGEIMTEHLPERVLSHGYSGDFRVKLPEGGVELEAVEKELIVQALERTSGNQTRAAELLGITRPTLIYRMEKHGLAKE